MDDRRLQRTPGAVIAEGDNMDRPIAGNHSAHIMLSRLTGKYRGKESDREEKICARDVIISPSIPGLGPGNRLLHSFHPQSAVEAPAPKILDPGQNRQPSGKGDPYEGPHTRAGGR